MTNLADIEVGPLRGKGPLGLEGVSDLLTTKAIITFNKVISGAIGLLTIVAAIWFVFLLLTGAISLMTAGGDKAKITEARSKITSAIIGIVVVVAAVFIIDLIGSLIGLDVLKGAILIPGLAPK